MPNWCDCELRIEGSKGNLDKCLQRIAGDDPDLHLDFNKVIPEPDNPPQTSHMPGWYTWRVEHWGTKWNLQESRLHRYQNSSGDVAGVIIYFETAWAPPEPVIEALTELFPDLFIELEYFESGMGFQGKMTYIPRIGEIISVEQEYGGARGG